MAELLHVPYDLAESRFPQDLPVAMAFAPFCLGDLPKTFITKDDLVLAIEYGQSLPERCYD